MSRAKSAGRRNTIGAGKVTVPADHAVLRRRVPDYLGLVMLIGAWQMSDESDFAVLWYLSRSVTTTPDEQQVT